MLNSRGVAILITVTDDLAVYPKRRQKCFRRLRGKPA